MMVFPLSPSCIYVSGPVTRGIIEVYFIFILALLILFQPKGEIKCDTEDAKLAQLSGHQQLIRNSLQISMTLQVGCERGIREHLTSPLPYSFQVVAKYMTEFLTYFLWLLFLQYRHVFCSDRAGEVSEHTEIFTELI